MRIWLRTLNETKFASGMGVVYNSVKKAFDNLNVNYTLDDPKEKCIELWIGWNFDIEPSPNFVIGYTTGETDIEAMKCYEQVNLWFFPTRYFVEQQLYKAKIYQWKYGIDSETLPYCERNWDEHFTFLHVGTTQYRKGTHIACKAFQKAFENNANVSLEIISPGETEEHMMLKQIYECDNIKFICFETDRKDIISKYSRGHCLVFPSLREGWGLHLCEALATGLPAIVSDLRIFDDQFDSQFGWWVNMTTEPSGLFKGIPDVKDLATKMIYAEGNRENCRKKGLLASNWCHKYLTWEYAVLHDFIPVLEKYGLAGEIFRSRNET